MLFPFSLDEIFDDDDDYFDYFMFILKDDIIRPRRARWAHRRINWPDLPKK